MPDFDTLVTLKEHLRALYEAKRALYERWDTSVHPTIKDAHGKQYQELHTQWLKDAATYRQLVGVGAEGNAVDAEVERRMESKDSQSRVRTETNKLVKKAVADAISEAGEINSATADPDRATDPRRHEKGREKPGTKRPEPRRGMPVPRANLETEQTVVLASVDASLAEAHTAAPEKTPSTRVSAGHIL